MPEKNSHGKAAWVVLVVGYGPRLVPGFAMLCMASRRIFKHFGTIVTCEEGEKLSGDFQDWKRQIGSKLEIVELDRGSATQFFRDKLGYDCEISKTSLDLRTLYWAIEGKELGTNSDFNDRGMLLSVLAIRQAALFSHLCKKRKELLDLQMAADQHLKLKETTSRRSHP